MKSNQSRVLAGIFNIDKPPRMTSHDVVNAVRRASGQKRVGHAGTLDPMATGVLVVCVGWATRLSEYLMEGKKHYRASVHLGVSTDTYDVEGDVVGVADICGITLERIVVALQAFEGQIEQVPPMYSAIKHDGIPLYRLARRGRTVGRAPRIVHIYELSIADWKPPIVTLDITCSKGTYVRSLAHDLGEELGCGAHLAALTRLASGPFRLDEAVSLSELVTALQEGRAEVLSYPLGRALIDFGTLAVDSTMAEHIRQGQAVEGPKGKLNSLAVALLPSGEPVAIIRYDCKVERWQPVKVFT